MFDHITRNLLDIRGQQFPGPARCNKYIRGNAVLMESVFEIEQREAS